MKFISKKLATLSLSFGAVVALGAAASLTGACTITTTDNGDGGITDNGDSGDTVDSGADANTQVAFPFQPSNISLAGLNLASVTDDADISGECSIEDTTDGDCFGGAAGTFLDQVVTQPGTGAASIHVIVVKSLNVEATANIKFLGATHPFVLIALGNITISGPINAGAAGNTAGPGGFIATGGNVVGGGPGGGAAATPASGTGVAGFGASGGSYCGVGGIGTGESGAIGSAGAAPTVNGPPDIRPLIGGSSGGAGGLGFGAGGGAIQIVAGGTFTLNQGGYINAGGGGGESYGTFTGAQNAGGGGTGGSILIEATTATIGGVLAANGGGGGGGQNGTDGTADGNIAPGGTGGGGGGAGGAGDTTAGSPAPAAPLSTAAGAGGGGVGRIRINTTSGAATVTGTISPSIASTCTSQGIVRAPGTGA